MKSFQHRLASHKNLQRFASLASWSLISFALEKAVMSAIIFLLARILGPESYGRLTLAQGLVSSAQLFVLLGSGTILARYVPEMRALSTRRAVEIINLSMLVVLGAAGVVALTGILGASRVATSILDLPASSHIPQWMVAWVLFTAASTLMLTVMLSFEKGRTIALVSLAGALLTAVAVPSLTISMGLNGSVIAMTAVESVKTALLLVVYCRLLAAEGVSIFTPARRSDVPLLLGFGAPVFLSSAIWGPTMWAGQLLLKNLSSQGLTAVGVFGVCNSMLGLVLIFSNVTNRAALPILASLKIDQADSIRKFTYGTIAFQLTLAALIGVPTAVFSPYIMTHLGQEFTDHWPTLSIMMLAAITIAGQQPIINILLIANKAYINLIGMAIWSTIFLSFSVLLISTTNIGAASLAISLTVASATRTAFAIFYARRTYLWSTNA